jgi:hypothetical protein
VYTIDKNLPRWPMFVECVPSSGNASCVSRASRQNKMTIDIPRTPSAWGFLDRVCTTESGRVERVRHASKFEQLVFRFTSSRLVDHNVTKYDLILISYLVSCADILQKETEMTDRMSPWRD